MQSRIAGFTLIEMLIYMALFILLSVVAVTSMLSFADSFKMYRAEHALNSQLASALDWLQLDLRNGLAVDMVGSTLSASSSVLMINYIGHDVTYTVSGGVLSRQVDGGTPEPLTQSPVTVGDFTADRYESTETELVRVRLTASVGTATSTVTEQYEVSSVLRGSYE